MHSPIRAILLDIEGTTSSIRFVFDVMFPFVRRELHDYLAKNWSDDDLSQACELIAKDAGHSSFALWCTTSHAANDVAKQSLIEREVIRLMDGDVKATGLKALQGLIWESGFASGELKAHVYDDVPPALKRWNAAGLDVRIYSSGSIQAQKLFFGHTVSGNLLSLLKGHYDTTTGPKREAASYAKIAGEFELPVDQILFLSDVVAELDAARLAGMQTGLVLRPGNATIASEHGHSEIRNFDEIQL